MMVGRTPFGTIDCSVTWSEVIPLVVGIKKTEVPSKAERFVPLMKLMPLGVAPLDNALTELAEN